MEDDGWHKACKRYQNFLSEHRDRRVLFLELGVGGNTPVIIKYPFWRLTAANKHATYACINLGEAYAPAEIKSRAVLIDADIGEILKTI